jgi:hypothetical protein
VLTLVLALTLEVKEVLLFDEQPADRLFLMDMFKMGAITEEMLA